MPLDRDVVDYWIQSRRYPIVLVLREDNGSSIATLREGLQDVRRVVGLVVTMSANRTCLLAIVVRLINTLSRYWSSE